MATVTLTTPGNYLAGTTQIEHGIPLVRLGSDTDTLVFPLLAPIGFTVPVIQNGAGTVTLSAASGATIIGNTSMAVTATNVEVVKVAATVWCASVYE